jgi:hypothetical protein
MALNNVECAPCEISGHQIVIGFFAFVHPGTAHDGHDFFPTADTNVLRGAAGWVAK